MIKKAMEYFKEQCAPHFETVDGKLFSDKTLSEVNPEPYADPIIMHTLSSLVEYIKSEMDVMHGKMLVHVESPERVSLFSALDRERRRETIANVYAMVPEFSFSAFIPHEKFCINVQAKFLSVADRALLLQFAGTVQSGTVAEYGDDGITQKATVKTGISTKAEAIVPNPVKLAAYRTFVEVDQPISDFVFRMKEDKCEGICCGLFEADGGAWRIEAMQNIAGYLKEQLADMEDYIVIS